MAILRILGGSTILENNVVQTIASAGEAVAAGAIFTFPALIILGGVKTLPYVEVTALCVVGATMGALLVVFLRRAYIVEERLPFPEGVACAQVLRAGDAQANVRPLVVGGLISAALKALQDVAGNYSGRGVGRAMDRRRGGGRVAGYFGGANRRRLHHRNQDRCAGVRRRRIRVARRDSRAYRVAWRRNWRRRDDRVATVERPGALPRRRRDAHRRHRDAVEVAHPNRVGDRRQHPHRALASRHPSPRRARTPIFRRARC